MEQDNINLFISPHLSLLKRITLNGFRPDKILRNIVRYITQIIEMKEHKISYGDENPDKIFYVVGVNVNAMGLLYIMLRNLVQFAYAKEHGYIPVVDLQNYDNQFLEKEVLYKENAWEYYFEQPMGYSLQDIKQSQHIVLSSKHYLPPGYMLDSEVLMDKDMNKLLYLKYLYKTYIKINKSTKDYLSADFDKLLKNKERVLGVLCRGTDYLLKKPVGHPIQPEPIEVIKKAKQVMVEKKCTHLYLATEDQYIYELFKTHFGEKLLDNGQVRFRRSDMENVEYLSQIHFDRARDKYLLGLEYLSSINLLSKCRYFIGGITGGTLGVYVMTEGFEYDYIWNLGKYPYKPK